jgi:DNA modification methylase
MNDPLTVICGDALTNLRELPAESVHMCCTSAPYWGLRDYGTAQWEGGDAECDHMAPPTGGPNPERYTPGGSEMFRAANDKPYRETCGKCGAKRIDSQLGLEKTPEEYVAKMVEIFREVRRVLRRDGTLWLNLGSSYASDPNKGGSGPNGKNEARWSYGRASRRDAQKNDKPCKEPKDSQANDYACYDLCGECATALARRTSGSDQSFAESVSPCDRITHDKSHSGSSIRVVRAVPVAVLASTTHESSLPPSGLCSHCANCGACLSVLRSSSRDASLCARKASCISHTSRLASAFHNQGKDVSDLGYSTIAFPKFKAKDMIPIPWMVAMALQADGWYLRQDIIWSKPNPMPESVTDRCTKAHEYLFLLTKSPRYFYDAEAIREPHDITCWSGKGDKASNNPVTGGSLQEGIKWTVATRNYNPAGRNRRSVWTVATAPYPEAHFATYPPDLIKPCILAGTSAKGCCAKCGAPWERIVEERRHNTSAPNSREGIQRPYGAGHGGLESRGRSAGWRERPADETVTLGWQPTCDCKDLSDGVTKGEDMHCKPSGGSAPPSQIPCTVLDPFAGSGTTGQVALELGRKAILIELNPKYVELIRQRCNVTPGLALA